MRRLAAILLLLLAGAAHAEPSGADTIELRVARADCVVLVDVTAIEGNDVTFRVVETIKGKPPQPLHFKPTVLTPFESAKVGPHHLLLFLVDTTLPFPRENDGILELTEPRVPAFSMDFDWLYRE